MDFEWSIHFEYYDVVDVDVHDGCGAGSAAAAAAAGYLVTEMILAVFHDFPIWHLALENWVRILQYYCYLTLGMDDYGADDEHLNQRKKIYWPYFLTLRQYYAQH